jgi:hypothetical protein
LLKIEQTTYLCWVCQSQTLSCPALPECPILHDILAIFVNDRVHNEGFFIHYELESVVEVILSSRLIRSGMWKARKLNYEGKKILSKNAGSAPTASRTFWEETPPPLGKGGKVTQIAFSDSHL